MKNIDLKLTILITLLCIPFVINEMSMRIILGLPLLLFLPGYSLVTTLFPKRHDLGVIERVALSFGLSIAVVSLLGLALNYTSLGIKLIPILIVISTFTTSLSIIAWIRRSKLPVEERFKVPFEKLLKINLGQSTLDKGLSIILVISIIISAVTLTYAVMTPKMGERFTEFYLLNSNGLASDYPTELIVGDEGELIIGIVNHEYENIFYHLEVEFNGFLIHEEHFILVENEIWESPFTFQVTEKGENLKLEFLLYKDQEVYRTLHLWVGVT